MNSDGCDAITSKVKCVRMRTRAGHEDLEDARAVPLDAAAGTLLVRGRVRPADGDGARALRPPRRLLHRLHDRLRELEAGREFAQEREVQLVRRVARERQQRRDLQAN